MVRMLTTAHLDDSGWTAEPYLSSTSGLPSLTGSGLLLSNAKTIHLFFFKHAYFQAYIVSLQ